MLNELQSQDSYCEDEGYFRGEACAREEYIEAEYQRRFWLVLRTRDLAKTAQQCIEVYQWREGQWVTLTELRASSLTREELLADTDRWTFRYQSEIKKLQDMPLLAAKVETDSTHAGQGIRRRQLEDIT